MLIMRMYALYERSKRVLALLLGVAIAAVAVGCVSLLLNCDNDRIQMFYHQWSILGGKKSKSPEILVPIGCGASLTHYQ